ncbi:MAG: hypothetical protein ACP5PJ_02695 [Acidimicrobiales bacterium]
MDRHITDEVVVGTLRLANRVIFGAHRTNLCVDREAANEWVEYLMQRSHGGTGAIVTETMSVVEEDWPYEYAPLLHRSLRGIETLGQRAHREHTAILISLGHSGGEGVSTYSQRALVGPSDSVGIESNEPTVPLLEDEIANLVERFANATTQALSAGADGVEINVGDRSLLRQFLSPITNDRDDRYGKDRAAFLEEVLFAVRAQARGAVVGMKLCADEQLPWGGIRIEESAGVLHRWLPFLDYLTITAGSEFARGRYRPDFRHPELPNLPLLESLKSAEHRSIGASPGPTAYVLSGGIRSAEHVAQALRDSSATLIEVTRAQIADPNFVRHLSRDVAPRPCLGCNQGCTCEDVRNFKVQCLVNPIPSMRSSEPDLPVVNRRPGVRPNKAVHIIGTGIAGLEFAVCAVGVTVHLYERSASIGGTARSLCDTAPGRYLNPLLAYYLDRLNRSTVVIHLGHEVRERSDLEAPSAFDIVVDARGAVGHDAGFGPLATPTWEIITNPSSIKGKCYVLVDDLGDEEGQFLAELIIESGADLIMVTRDPVIGSRRAETGDLVTGLSRIRSGNVETHTLSTVRPTGAQTISIEGRFGGPTHHRQVDGVVVTGARRALSDVSPLPFNAIPLGDALAPRSLRSAILDARLLASSLDEGKGIHS